MSDAKATREDQAQDAQAANKGNFIFVGSLSGFFALVAAHFLDSLARGNHVFLDFGLEQGVVMCVAVCAVIAFLSNKRDSVEPQYSKERNINKVTIAGFLLFLLLPVATQLSPAFFALVDQLRLPILAVFAGFFLCQTRDKGNLNKISGNTLAYGGALAFAYPLITLWVQSGDNVNQFAQTMFKAHCPEAVAAIVGIVLSLGMLAYSYSDEIRSGCYRLWHEGERGMRLAPLAVAVYSGAFGMALMITNLVLNGADFQQYAKLAIGSEVLLGIAILSAFTYAVSKEPKTVNEPGSS